MVNDIEQPTTTDQWVVFRLGGEEYAVLVTEIQEIIRVPAITPVPSAASFVEGVINLRGRIVPIVDLAVRLGLPPSPRSPASRVVVTHVNDRAVGLLVDAVSEVLSLGAEHLETAVPFLKAMPIPACFQGVAKWQDRLVLLLALPRVLSAEENQALDAMPAER